MKDNRETYKSLKYFDFTLIKYLYICMYAYSIDDYDYNILLILIRNNFLKYKFYSHKFFYFLQKHTIVCGLSNAKIF